ncbi:hypothetical protein, partial [Paenibacillus sp. GbtcB18]|uniref:hypothetical protein n=1 Tax=Paenibacillus sp. GbtcB18 TaxID=2824763 RepID=UPI001C2FDCC3
PPTIRDGSSANALGALGVLGVLGSVRQDGRVDLSTRPARRRPRDNDYGSDRSSDHLIGKGRSG